MPIYEYVCARCGHRFDFLARTLADKPAHCPECRSAKLTKAFSTFQAQAKQAPGACSTACPHAHSSGCGCGCCH